MEKPWREKLPKSQKRQWLDEYPEIMKNIPGTGERVASFWVRQLRDTPLRAILIIIGALPIFLFFEKRHGRIPPIIEVSEFVKAGSAIFFLVILGSILYIGRKEKGHIDIYPEMVVFYDYDHNQKKARPTRFYHWKDVVQYHGKDPYLWLHSRETLPVNTVISIKKLRPYLKQYAPQAKEAIFYMKDYWKMVEKNADRHSSSEEVTIEAAMAANREKAEDRWKKYPEE